MTKSGLILGNKEEDTGSGPTTGEVKPHSKYCTIHIRFGVVSLRGRHFNAMSWYGVLVLIDAVQARGPLVVTCIEHVGRYRL